jgi:hypothetical protein
MATINGDTVVALVSTHPVGVLPRALIRTHERECIMNVVDLAVNPRVGVGAVACHDNAWEQTVPTKSELAPATREERRAACVSEAQASVDD